MDTAWSGVDGHPWDAVALNKKAATEASAWLESRRPYFICCGCEAPAIFRRAFSNNRTANFAASHGECDFLSDSSGGLKNGPGDPVAAQYNMGGNKEIRYDMPGPLNKNVGQAVPGTVAGKSTGTGKVHSLPPVKGSNAYETTGLKRILANLRNGPNYPPPGIRYDVTSRGKAVPASDYLVSIGSLTAQTATDNHTRAYWGEVTNVDESGQGDNTVLWIHCDNNGLVFTFRLDNAARLQLYAALGISGYSALRNTHVIVEGVMMRGGKKLYITVTDIKKMAFLPVRVVPKLSPPNHDK